MGHLQPGHPSYPNNLKGIFFKDDNMEHMAFSVIGRWGEKGVTIIRVLDFDQLQQIGDIS